MIWSIICQIDLWIPPESKKVRYCTYSLFQLDAYTLYPTLCTEFWHTVIRHYFSGQVYNTDHANFADLTSLVFRVCISGSHIGQKLNRRSHICGLSLHFRFSNGQKPKLRTQKCLHEKVLRLHPVENTCIYYLDEDAEKMLKDMTHAHIVEINQALTDGEVTPHTRKCDIIPRIAVAMHILKSVTKALLRDREIESVQ